jgi:NAD(P)-dependent dehydrogenase (short-subunit alcohol dehydrogenase family)
MLLPKVKDDSIWEKPMGRLDGKVAIVTGAGRGIGRAITRRLAAEGAKVAVVSVTPANVDALTEELNAKHGAGTAIGVYCDVGEEAQIKAAVAKTVEAFGTVDIAINNAFELASGMHSVLDTKVEDFHRQMVTGPLAALHMMQAVYPYMEGRDGRILNLGSPAAMDGFPGFAPYNMAKEAIRALTRTAAKEWGAKRITVNALCPVAFTEGVQKAVDEGLTSAESTNPIPRMGDMDKDVAPVALFLVSPEAGYVTGYSWHADGGFKIDAAR